MSKFFRHAFNLDCLIDQCNNFINPKKTYRGNPIRQREPNTENYSSHNAFNYCITHLGISNNAHY